MQSENYTNPEQAGEGQNPQDLINASLIFARALGLILKNGEGIVVDVVVGISTYFVIVDRRAVLNGGHVGNDDALRVIIDLIVVNVGIYCCFNGQNVIEKSVVLDFAIISRLNSCAVI